MHIVSEEIRAYLADVPEPHKSMLEHLHAVIRSEAPEAAETIAYGIPTFKLDGNLVHYAAFKQHCSFFPGSTAHHEPLRDELAGYTLSKGTIRFTRDKPLPEALVRRIVRLRIAENRVTAAARKSVRRHSAGAKSSTDRSS